MGRHKHGLWKFDLEFRWGLRDLLFFEFQKSFGPIFDVVALQDRING